MNADVPRHRCGRRTAPLRTTDYARVLLRRAQWALAALAVPVAMTVGFLVASPGQPAAAAQQAPAATQPAARQTAALQTAVLETAVLETAVLETAGEQPAGMQVHVVGIPVSRAAASPTEPGTGQPAPARAAEIAGELVRNHRAVDGILAGLVTLGCCWILLAIGVVIWRRRLDERDLRDWADGWARVEPTWSDRIL